MQNYQYDFERQTTLERKKIADYTCEYYKYEYYIEDFSGNRIADIDTKYYNCNKIGEANICLHEEEVYDEDGNEEKRNYYTSFSFYQFSYNYRTPKYTLIEIIRSDTYGEYKETISEFDGWVSEIEDYEIEVDSMYRGYEIEPNEQGNEELILKAIINDSGDVIMDGILEIYEFISSIDAIIIKLPLYKGCPYIDYEKVEAADEYWAVINLKGDFIIKPTPGKIDYLKKSRLFAIVDYFLYDESGVKHKMLFKDLFNNEEEYENFRFNNRKLSEL
jgi:hypothetical protein